MKAKTLDWLFAGATIILGFYIFYGAIGYGYWKSDAPGSGFFPLITSVGIIALGIVNFIRAVANKEKLSNELDVRDFYKPTLIVICTALYIWLIPYLGMVISSGLLVLATGMIIRRKRDKLFIIRLSLLASFFPIFGYFLFSYYLGVPLKEGAFGI